MNKKGFTLIELLTVIVILGLVTVISIPLFSNLQGSSKRNSFKYYNDLITQAASLYHEKYVKSIDEEDTNTCVKLDYKRLLELKLIKEDNFSCTGIIYAEKVNNGFDFTNYLDCKDKDGNVVSENSTKVPSDKNCYTLDSVINKTLVKFNYNGGVGNVSQKVVSPGEKYADLPTPNDRKGYTFAGWYTEKENGSKVEKETIITTDIEHTLYAHWESKEYNLTLKDASDNVIDTIKVKYGKKYSNLPTPSKENYIFKGWYTEKENGNKVSNDTLVRIPSDHTLYARYDGKVKFRLVSDYGNDGIGGGDEISISKNGKTDNFYILSYSDNKIKALSKYNLNIGDYPNSNCEVNKQCSNCSGESNSQCTITNSEINKYLGIYKSYLNLTYDINVDDIYIMSADDVKSYLETGWSDYDYDDVSNSTNETVNATPMNSIITPAVGHVAGRYPDWLQSRVFWITNNMFYSCDEDRDSNRNSLDITTYNPSKYNINSYWICTAYSNETFGLRPAIEISGYSISGL